MSHPSLIHHFLEHSSSRLPDKIALVHEGTRATYAEINSKANSLANWLLEQGVLRGDRIVILMDNSLEYVVTYYGILKAGAVAVPLSAGLRPSGIELLLGELEPAVILLARKFERLLRALNPSLIQDSKLVTKNPSSMLSDRGLEVTGFDEITCLGNHGSPNLEIEEDSLASIIYTSGSTGRPKGVMLSHKNVVSNTMAICQYLRLTREDVQMVVLPFFYVMGKSLLNTHFAVGGRVVINNKFAYPATVLKQMVEEQVTGFSGVPSTYAYLLHRSPLEKYRDRLISLRYCTQAGGHMARSIKAALRRILPGHTAIFIMYGATEASARLSYLAPDRFEDKMDSIGKPIPGVKLKVLDPEGKETAPGEHGEIVASGPNIMQGYWRDPEATSRVLDGMGYHTGDLGYRDDEGFFYVAARRDNLLKVGGHRINPTEVEDVILSSNSVVEAVVLGLDDTLLGTRIVALVVPKSGDCRAEEILRYCSRDLPRHKLPSEIRFVRVLPKSPSGKIDREACRAGKLGS